MYKWIYKRTIVILESPNKVQLLLQTKNEKKWKKNEKKL